MPLQLRNRHRRQANIKNHNLIIVDMYLKSCLFHTILNSGVFLVAQVKDPDGPIGGDRRKDSSFFPRYVVNLFIVR